MPKRGCGPVHVHYALRLEPSADRLLFPRAGATASLQHNWYLQRRRRPKGPHFAACPVPKGFADNADANARLTQIYFRAWTLNLAQATDAVPFLICLVNTTAGKIRYDIGCIGCPAQKQSATWGTSFPCIAYGPVPTQTETVKMMRPTKL